MSTLPSPLSRSPFSFHFTRCFGGGHRHAPLLPPPLTDLNPYLSTKVQSGTNAATPSTIPSNTRCATGSLTSSVHPTRRVTISLPLKLAKLRIPMDPCNSSFFFLNTFPLGSLRAVQNFNLMFWKIKVDFTILWSFWFVIAACLTQLRRLLLTIPPSVGYEQNPLSVYYCYDVEGSTTRLKRCIAEVCGKEALFSYFLRLFWFRFFTQIICGHLFLSATTPFTCLNILESGL